MPGPGASSSPLPPPPPPPPARPAKNHSAGSMSRQGPSGSGLHLRSEHIHTFSILAQPLLSIMSNPATNP
eukprot:scaffold193617_cov19-Tisochrysis_lutea.AAC.1